MHGGTTLRVLIADDEADARDRLRDLLLPAAGVDVVAECGDTATLGDQLVAAAPDVAFLDIRMPGREIFAVLGELDAERLPELVFVTAHEHHALAAFSASALDYLLKPFTAERLHAALARAREAVRRRRCAQLAARLSESGELAELAELAGLDELAAPTGPTGPTAPAAPAAGGAPWRAIGRMPAYAERLPVRRDGVVAFVRTADIEWLDAARNTVRLNAGGTSHLLRARLGTLERRLDPRKFVRIHRSTVVNVDKLKELRVTLQGSYVAVVESGRRLAVSRTHRNALDRLLGETF
jgi:two-component system LytT family response regulator